MSRGNDDIEYAEKAAAKQRLVEADIADGLKSGSVEGVIKNSAMATKDAQNSAVQRAEKQAKNSYDDILFIAMMNEIDEAIARSEKRLGDLEEKLEAQFGDDWDQDIYEMHFGDRGADLTQEDRIEALKDIYLDEDGNLKPQYKDTAIGAYLEENERLGKLRELRENDPEAAIVMVRETGVHSGAVEIVTSATNMQEKVAAFEAGQSIIDEVQEKAAAMSMQMPFQVASAGEAEGVHENEAAIKEVEIVSTKSAFMPFS